MNNFIFEDSSVFFRGFLFVLWNLGLVLGVNKFKYKYKYVASLCKFFDNEGIAQGKPQKSDFF